MAPTLRSLPVNVTDRTLALWSCQDDGWQTEQVPGTIRDVRLEGARPAREFASWPGKRNYEGLWWSSTTRAHVAFESLLERDALLWLDWDQDVTAISSQPVAFLWPKDTPSQRSHVPDYFVRLASGDGKLIDVRGTHGLTTKAVAQFDMTRAACAEIGWQYEVWTGLPDSTASSLRWLAGYRQDRCAPSPTVADRLTAAFQRGAALGDGIDQVAAFASVSREIVTANVYHLLWTHQLTADLTRPLSWETEVVTM